MKKLAKNKTIAYDHKSVEIRQQKLWAKSNIYLSKDEYKKPKYYILDMFPYPSGEGLHVGHPKGYIATDVISRLKRMRGYSVLHPMGFDAFGLPAENYALKTKTNPEIAVKKNVIRYKDQLHMLGLDYDWSREVNTTDPKYYKWTQWIFLQLFKKGLAFESYEPINWCPSCKTGLANEDLEDGRCERCGTPIEKKPLRQWVLRITDYADRLLNDLNIPKIPEFSTKTGTDAFRPDMPISERQAVYCIIKHWKDDSYLGMKWKKNNWRGYVIGGIEHGESIEQTAVREVIEETGYKNVVFKKVLGQAVCKFYQELKEQNRVAHATVVYLELLNGEQNEIADHEKVIQDLEWVPREKMRDFVNREDLKYMWDLFTGAANPQTLLDWPTSIVKLQQDWIGRSEGALLKFKINGSKVGGKEIEVFTTRPDTLFGVTYVVLAPESSLVSELLSSVSNRKEVEEYISKAKLETEIERTDAKKEKTGVELKGIKAQNPANGDEVPVWISDYVLADYGTGAVMAVPAHDERDFEFAKKFKLPIKEVVAFEYTGVGVDAPRPNVETLDREIIDAVIENDDGEFLLIKEVTDGITHIHFVGGGTDGEESTKALSREILEETGYTDFEIKSKIPGGIFCRAFRHTKSKNQNTFGYGYHVKLKNENKIKSEADEGRHSLMWVKKDQVSELITWPHHVQVWNTFLKTNKSFIDDGKLVDSGEFNNLSSAEARRKITEKFGKKVVKYKLRDWVFSRQRYWGEPIPVVHCEQCAIKSSKKDAKISLNFYYKDIWEALKNGTKTIETRALNPEEKDRYFGNTKVGDIIHAVFKDQKTKKVKEEKLLRIKSVKVYKSLEELFADKVALSKLRRKNVKSLKELEAGYNFTPDYQEKIKKNGLIAWEIEPVTLAVPVPEKDLPVKLPKVKSYEPTGTGESPLAAIHKWVNTKCPICKGPARRETNTMPQWAGSSWYYLRYEDNKNDKKLVDPKKEKYWSPIDLYVGGAEHATRHLIYARFWHKFLYDIGAVSTIEPFIKLQHVGLIMGEDGRKMSKRFGNVVNPDEIVKTYGADTLRVYEMFMGPFDQQISWNTSSMIGARRFIERIWKLMDKVEAQRTEEGLHVLRTLHKAIKKVTDDIESIHLNTAISTLMITVNEMEKAPSITREQYEILLKLIAPFAPHVADELWQKMGNKKSIHVSAWPVFDASLAADSMQKIMVQVNGKVRGSFDISPDATEDELKNGALNLPEVKKWTDDKEIKKVIVIKGKLVSIVVA